MTILPWGAYRYLCDLLDTVSTLHIDMRGPENNRYALTQKSMPLMAEIKAWISDPVDDGKLSPNFRRAEFVCRCGCGFDTVDVELVYVLQGVSEHYGRAVVVNSGCRCPKHNKSVDGEEDSRHLIGQAADVVVRGVPAHKVAEYLEERYPDKYGIGRYLGWTHIDVRKEKARWTKKR